MSIIRGDLVRLLEKYVSHSRSRCAMATGLKGASVGDQEQLPKCVSGPGQCFSLR